MAVEGLNPIPSADITAPKLVGEGILEHIALDVFHPFYAITWLG